MWNNFLIKNRRPLIIATHLFLVSFSYWLSFVLRFDFIIPAVYWTVFLKTFPIIILLKLVVFYYSGIYYGLWRYVSIGDIWQIIKANFISTLFFVLVIVLMPGVSGFPRSIFILDLVLSVVLISGVRLFTRLFRERFKPSRVHKKYNP